MKDFFKGIWVAMLLNYICGKDLAAKLLPKTTTSSWILRQTFMIIWMMVSTLWIPIGLILMAIKVIRFGTDVAARDVVKNFCDGLDGLNLTDQAQEEMTEVLQVYTQEE